MKEAEGAQKSGEERANSKAIDKKVCFNICIVPQFISS
jgi:hypothetical protein